MGPYAFVMQLCEYDRIYFMKRSGFFKQRVDILFMPQNSAPVKIKFSMAVLLLAAAVVFALFICACYVLIKSYDYHVMLADNQLVKAKLALIAEELDSGRKYLEMTKNTDLQMRQMLGMEGGANVNNPNLFDEEKAKGFSFAKIFKKSAAEINETDYEGYLEDIEASAQAQLASFQEIAWFYANKRNLDDFTPSARPSAGRITSGFGYRLNPFGRRETKFHQGLDFAGKADSPILAAANGVVRHTGWASGFGQAVLIDHGFGYSTLYAHVTDIKVKAGDTVKRGDKIATMGTTGRSTGVHLHYEVWKDGAAVNPRNYFK